MANGTTHSTRHAQHTNLIYYRPLEASPRRAAPKGHTFISRTAPHQRTLPTSSSSLLRSWHTRRSESPRRSARSKRRPAARSRQARRPYPKWRTWTLSRSGPSTPSAATGGGTGPDLWVDWEEVTPLPQGPVAAPVTDVSNESAAQLATSIRRRPSASGFVWVTSGL